MPIICPTVLADDPHEFRRQMERLAPFAQRIQIDLTDGKFAPSKTVSLDRVWWLHSVQADLHLMYRDPIDVLDEAIELGPRMVIVHAEARGDFTLLSERLQDAGILIGVALLPQTPLDIILPVIDSIDHVLIFAGNLGHFGGEPSIAEHAGKVTELRRLYPDMEIGWDGGVTDKNAGQLVDLGVDVLNVGGFIQQAENPMAAYAKLTRIAGIETDHETKTDT
jgi:ribulose-phosphate 3-epimerase